MAIEAPQSRYVQTLLLGCLLVVKKVNSWLHKLVGTFAWYWVKPIFQGEVLPGGGLPSLFF